VPSGRSERGVTDGPPHWSRHRRRRAPTRDAAHHRAARRYADLARATITISKQVERTKAKDATIVGTKKTKTKRTRTVDVEPNLYPLGEHLAKHPDGKGRRLLRVPPSEDYAELLRKDLWTVGARDERLHTGDSTRTKMTGHDLRDTGLTHVAVRGDSPIVIQWCGGHTDFKMTQGGVHRSGPSAGSGRTAPAAAARGAPRGTC
jgi:integrase